jgi:hypothetical protein
VGFVHSESEPCTGASASPHFLLLSGHHWTPKYAWTPLPLPSRESGCSFSALSQCGGSDRVVSLWQGGRQTVE